MQLLVFDAQKTLKKHTKNHSKTRFVVFVGFEFTRAWLGHG